MRYTSIDPATRYIAGSTGKRCLGILCKCLPRERERESFLTARLSFAQRTRRKRGGTDRKKSSSSRSSRIHPYSCRRATLARGLVSETEACGEKKGEKKVGGKGQRKGRGQRAEERATNGRGEEGRGVVSASTTRTEHTICQSVLSIIRVYSCGPRINPSSSPPPSPVICLGQIQSQPRGGFELTINFKRVRRRRPRATAAGEGGERRTQTVFSRVSDRRSAKGINLS